MGPPAELYPAIPETQQKETQGAACCCYVTGNIGFVKFIHATFNGLFQVILGSLDNHLILCS